MSFLVKQDEKLYTGKTYRHNFQWFNFEEENCVFYVWHKKEIKLIESKNLWSTMNIFFLKDWKLEIDEVTYNIKSWIFDGLSDFFSIWWREWMIL